MGLNLGRFIRDRKRDIQDVFDANTQQDQQRRVAQGQPRMYADQRAQRAQQAPPRPGPQFNQPVINQRQPRPDMVFGDVTQPNVQAPTEQLSRDAQVLSNPQPERNVLKEAATTINNVGHGIANLTPQNQVINRFKAGVQTAADPNMAIEEKTARLKELSRPRAIFEDTIPGGAMGADLIREVGPRGAARILESASKNKVTSTIPNVKGAAETVRNIQKTGAGKFIFGDKPIETAEQDLKNLTKDVPIARDLAKFGPLATVAGVAMNLPGVGGLDDAGKAAKVIAGTDNLDDIAKVVVNTPDLEKAIANLDDAKKAQVLEDLAKETDPKNVKKIVQEAAQDTGKPKVALKQPDGQPNYFKDETEISQTNRILKNEDTVATGEKIGDYYRSAKGEDWQVVKMTPDEYLRRANRALGNSISEAELGKFKSGDVAKYAEDMKNGDKFPMPWINEVAGSQEGRTRALAAKAAGQDEIPVALAPKLEKLTPEARANQGVPEVNEAFKVDAGTPTPTAGADSPIVMSGGGRSNVPETVKPFRTDVEPKKVGLVTEVKRAMSDKDQVILSELRSIEKQTGQKGLVDKFMYNSNMQRGSNATANQVLATSENVSSAIGDLSKSDYRAFSDYANARTELSRATKDTPLSRSRGELEQLVKGASPDQIARFQALNNHYKELAIEAYKAGLITKERLAAYAANDDYVRLQRDMDDLVSAGSQGKGNSYSLGSTILDQKRKGSSRATLGAGETAAEYTQDVYKEIARNRTATGLADVLTESGLARKVDSATNKNVINVRRNGITEHYEVSGEIKQAVDNINPYHMNVVMKILAAPGRVMRAGITGLNPVFIARNLLKDQIGSAINSDSIMATHNPKSFFSGLLNASSDAVGANNSALYADFLKHYGDQTSFDLTRNAKEAGQVVNRIRGGKAVGIGQGIKAPIRSLENFASITEKSTRFQNYAGEYKKAIKAGLEPAEASEKAAIAAWQNSVDFSRAGTWGRAINTVVPYWNPATQGVRQMGRTFTKHPVKSGFTATALVGVPLAAATAWNLSSPETAEVYANIPEYEKENNIILIPPGTEQNKDGSYDIIKIPLTPGYKDAFMPIRRALEAYHGDKPLEAGQLAQDLLQTISGPVSTQSAGAFAGSFIPQAAKPIAQWGMNQDFFTGKKTVPDYVNEATDAQGNPIPENKKAYEYTSGLSRGIGNLTNSSPMKVEKAVKDVGGTVGLNLLNAADRVLAKTGKIPEEQIGGQSVAEGFKRSFGQAQGIDNGNKSAGAKYFETVSRLQGEVKLTNAEKNAWDALHPGKKNFLGDTVYEADSTYNPAARLDAYNRFPKTFELDKKLDAENRKAGKPGNPMYDLEPWQVKKVLEKDNLPPGADDPELSKLREKDWYADYSTKKSKFFTDLTARAKKEGREFGDSSNPYPTTPPDLQKIMDSYSALPSGTGARSSWIKSNPGQWKRMQDQYAKMDNWQNIARGERGLDATEGDTGIAAGYGDSSSSSYGRGGGGRGSGGSGGSKTKSAGDPYKYAIDPNAGGGKKLNTSVSVKTPDKSKVAAKKVNKPKVTLKKARV